MSKNYDQEAHNQGQKDSSKSSERSSTADIIADQIFGGSYNPPKGHEESYKEGWDNNKNQKK